MQNFDVNHQPVISWETPWGKQVQIEKNDKYTVKILHINEGESLSPSGAALIVLRKMGYQWSSVSGNDYWQYEDETLAARRLRLEDEQQ